MLEEYEWNKKGVMMKYNMSLSVTAKLWKGPKCPLTDEWIKEWNTRWNITQPSKRTKPCHLH